MLRPVAAALLRRLCCGRLRRPYCGSSRRLCSMSVRLFEAALLRLPLLRFPLLRFPCCGSPCCGSPCCGSPCCGSPCCGCPCCGSPCCGSPCCGSPCCGSPCCGSTCCISPCCTSSATNPGGARRLPGAEACRRRPRPNAGPPPVSVLRPTCRLQGLLATTPESQQRLFYRFRRRRPAAARAPSGCQAPARLVAAYCGVCGVCGLLRAVADYGGCCV